MRKQIRVSEGDAGYMELCRLAEEAVKSMDNTVIVARGKGNRKGNIKPLTEMNGIAFYAAHDIGAALVYTENVDDETLFSAVSNTVRNARIIDMESFLTNQKNPDLKTIEEWEPGTDGGLHLYVLTNARMTNSAGILFCNKVLHDIWVKVGNYHLIPSSIHELIVLPDKDDEFSSDAITGLLKQVNSFETMEEERLSDSSFYYDGKLN